MKINLNSKIIYIIIIIGLAIAFILTQLNSCQKDQRIKNLQERASRNLKAMSDTIVKTDSITFKEKVPELTEDQIKSSPYYKQLENKTQKYISKLNKKQEIIAATRFKVQKKDSIIDSLQYKNKLSSSTDSTLTFDKGTKFDWKDTVNSLTLKQEIILNKHLERNLNYKIIIEPNIIFSKTEDGIVKGTYKFKDPNLQVKGKGSFVVPKFYTKEAKIEIDLSPTVGYLINDKSFNLGAKARVEHGRFSHDVGFTFPDNEIQYSFGIRIFKSK